MPVSQNAEKRAMGATVQARKGFGLVKYVEDAWVCFNESTRMYDYCDEEDPGAKYEIKIGIELFKKDGVWVSEQRYIESNQRDNKWIAVTLPSLKKINATLSTIENKWVEIEFRPLPPDKNGKIWDTFHFVRIFPSQESCEEAYANSIGFRQNVSSSGDGDQQSPSSNGDDDAVVRAAKTLLKIAGGDKAKFVKEASRNPLMVGSKGKWETADEAFEAVSAEEKVEDLPF